MSEPVPQASYNKPELLHLLQDVMGKHLLKVEPLNAILDPQYFVRAVHELVTRVLATRVEKSQKAAADLNTGSRSAQYCIQDEEAQLHCQLARHAGAAAHACLMTDV